MTRHLGPHALAIHVRPWFLHLQVYSCMCCPVSRTPYPGKYLPGQAWWPGTRTTSSRSAGMATRTINSMVQMYGRDARMPSVGRLIPVSGGFQNSAVRVSRAGPFCCPASLHLAPAPRTVSSDADATKNPVVDGDQSRSEQVTPS